MRPKRNVLVSGQDASLVQLWRLWELVALILLLAGDPTRGEVITDRDVGYAGRRLRQTASAGPPSPARVIVHADGLVYDGFETSQALEAVPGVTIDYLRDPLYLVPTVNLLSREYYDVIVFPKLSSYQTDYWSDIYTFLVDFMMDGGAVLYGASPASYNMTELLTGGLANTASSAGDPGYGVTLNCSGPTQQFGSVDAYTRWDQAQTPTPRAWPTSLEAAPNFAVTAYSVNCGLLTDIRGAVMYSAAAGLSADEAAVFSFPRGTGRAYYVGVDFDSNARAGTWTQLLEAIVLQAAANPTRVTTLKPPPPPAPAAPVDTTTASLPASSATSVPWPLARGRYSYSSEGATATAALTAPLPADADRNEHLCHRLPLPAGVLLNETNANATSGSPPSYVALTWLAFDLGTLRRVESVRIQALVAKDITESWISGTVARLQVRVGSTPVSMSGDNIGSNGLLCPGKPTHTISVGAQVYAGEPAAVVVECGPAGSEVGRYVSISILDFVPDAASVKLCGVDVMGSIPETYSLVSRNKPVCSSSRPKTYIPATAPWLAVDGLYNDNRGRDTALCAMSDLVPSPFITIDLGHRLTIERVEVTKSASAAHSLQLSDFNIYVTDDPRCLSPTVLPLFPENICGEHLELAPGETGVYNCSRTRGRYLTISRQENTAGDHYLRVCEVDVYASLPPTAWSGAYPLSVHKPVTAFEGPNSTTASLLLNQAGSTTKFIGGLLVDALTSGGLRAAATQAGLTRVDLSSACVNASTSGWAGGSPWLALDLGEPHMVAYVQVGYDRKGGDGMGTC